MAVQMLSVERFLRDYLMSRSEFYRQVHAGQIRLVKRGRRSFVMHTDVQKWVDSLKEYTG